MSGLSGSKRVFAIVRAHNHCVPSAVAMISAMLDGVWSKPSMPTPYVRSSPREKICQVRASRNETCAILSPAEIRTPRFQWARIGDVGGLLLTDLRPCRGAHNYHLRRIEKLLPSTFVWCATVVRSRRP